MTLAITHSGRHTCRRMVQRPALRKAVLRYHSNPRNPLLSDLRMTSHRLQAFVGPK